MTRNYRPFTTVRVMCVHTAGLLFVTGVSQHDLWMKAH